MEIKLAPSTRFFCMELLNICSRKSFWRKIVASRLPLVVLDRRSRSWTLHQNCRLSLQKVCACSTLLTMVLLLAGCTADDTQKNLREDATISSQRAGDKGKYMGEKIVKTDAEWKKLLTPQQFDVTRKKGTEPAGSGEYAYSEGKGIYQCACCELPLFASENKFDSGTGWPSFDTPFVGNNVAEEEDRGFFMVRTEVLCGRCNAHLGHVFPDGPSETTGLRYCINSAALNFEPKEQGENTNEK